MSSFQKTKLSRIVDVKKRLVSIINILCWVSGLTTFGIMFLVTSDVLARYIFRQPIKGTMDICEMSLVVIGFLGMAYTQAEQSHVHVDVLITRLSGRTQAIFNVISTSLGAVVFGLIGLSQLRKGLGILVSLEVGPQTDLLFIPHAPFILVASFGCFLLCAILVLDTIENIAKNRQGIKSCSALSGSRER
jgi:TRAP-type C4-dicarboxylate transport system permease small subunit